MKIAVRPARQSDLSWLQLLHAGDEFNRWIVRKSDDPRSLAHEFLIKLAAQRRRQGVFVVADARGSGRGYGVLLLSVKGHSAHVEFGVDPYYQRQGIGGVLLDETLRTGCRIGPELKDVKAVCHRDNEGCIGLLRSRGFVPSEMPELAVRPYLGWHLAVDVGEIPAC